MACGAAPDADSGLLKAGAHFNIRGQGDPLPSHKSSPGVFSCRISELCVHSYHFYISTGTNQSKHKSCSNPTTGPYKKGLNHTLGPILWLKGTHEPHSSVLGVSVLTSYKHHHTTPRGQVNASPCFHQSKMCAPFIIREREATPTDRLLSVPDGATDRQPTGDLRPLGTNPTRPSHGAWQQAQEGNTSWAGLLSPGGSPTNTRKEAQGWEPSVHLHFTYEETGLDTSPGLSRHKPGRKSRLVPAGSLALRSRPQRQESRARLPRSRRRVCRGTRTASGHPGAPPCPLVSSLPTSPGFHLPYTGKVLLIQTRCFHHSV